MITVAQRTHMVFLVTGKANFSIDCTSLTVGGFTQPAVARPLIKLPSSVEKGFSSRFGASQNLATLHLTHWSLSILNSLNTLVSTFTVYVQRHVQGYMLYIYMHNNANGCYAMYCDAKCIYIKICGWLW